MTKYNKHSIEFDRLVEDKIYEQHVDETELDSYRVIDGFTYADGHDDEIFTEWDTAEEFEAKKEALIYEIKNNGFEKAFNVCEKWKEALKNEKLKKRITNYTLNIITNNY